MIDLFDRIGVPADLEQRLLLILQGGTVKRFHTTPTLHENKNGQHQWGTAMLAYILSSNKPSVNLLMACLTHDLAEKVYGDTPAPAKRALGIRATINNLEAQFLEANEAMFELTDDERQILKLADILDGMLRCVYERMLGNRWVDVVYQRFHGYATNELKLTEHQKLVLAHVDKLWEDCIGAN
jgi:5'-deoxynucleotidase YfbR-like HD superfamily hydrolase